MEPAATNWKKVSDGIPATGWFLVKTHYESYQAVRKYDDGYDDRKWEVTFTHYAEINPPNGTTDQAITH